MPSREILLTTGLIIVIALGTAATLFYAQTTLRNIEHAIPIEVVKQKNNIRTLEQESAELVAIIKASAENPEIQLDIAEQLELMRVELEEIRQNSTLDNPVGVAEIFTVISPAITDMETWLAQGAQGFYLNYAEMLGLVEQKAIDTHSEVMVLSANADKKAFELLNKQSQRIIEFRNSLTVVLLIVVLLALMLIRLVLRQQKANRLLKESKAVLSAFMEHTPTDMVIKNKMGQYLQASRFSRRLFNVQEGDVFSTMPGTHFPEELVGEFLEHDKEIFTTGQSSEREHNLPTPEGSTVLHVLKFPIVNELGEVYAVGSIGLDITELRRSEARFRDFAGIASDWFWEMDANLRYTYVSGRFEEIMGIAAADILGKTREEAFSGRIDDWVRWKQRGQLLKNREEFSLIFKMQRPDGSPRILQTQASPFCSNDGKFAGYRGVSTDITERTHADELLLQSEQRFRDIATFASDYIWEMDSLLRFTYLSDGCQRVIGLSPDQLTGTKTREFWLKYMAQPEKWSKYFSILTSHQSLDGIEVEWKKPGGMKRFLKITGKPRFDDTGKFLGYRGGVSDFTEIALARQAAKKSQRIAEAANLAKTNFLANISHEIRTPMTLVIGMSDLLQESKLDSRQQQLLGTIKDAGDSLLKLINRILDVSKIESGYVSLTHENFNIEEMINNICRNYKTTLDDTGVVLRTNLSEDVQLNQTGDRHRVDQVFRNLIDNAIKFTEAGEIIISVENNPRDSYPGNLQFSVSDTGIGISQDQFERIFEVFVQQDASTTRQYGGAGLGLAICQQIVDVMGGEIWVESELGKGSTFYFTVLFDGDNTGVYDQPTLVDSSNNSNSLKILLVDDDVLIRELIKELLHDTHHEIITASNGEEAVITFKSNAPDLILMDLRMPVMDGYSATRRIRSWEQSNQKQPVPIIALTASVLLEDKDKCLSEGFTTHLSKPVHKTNLILAIDEYNKPKLQ